MRAAFADADRDEQLARAISRQRASPFEVEVRKVLVAHKAQPYTGALLVDLPFAVARQRAFIAWNALPAEQRAAVRAWAGEQAAALKAGAGYLDAAVRAA